VRKHPEKVWKTEQEFVVGFSGNFAVGQFLRFDFHWDPVSYPIERWLITVVQPKLKHKIVKRFEKSEEWNLLIGIEGRIFLLSPCGDVEETIKPFAAIGSGSDCAMGALEALYLTNVDMPSWERVETALYAASATHADVKGPMHLIV
jgi:ATP-dependent protease HslVU (ClpYQ) peptidase subunit